VPVPVPMLAPAQTRIHGHGRSQIQGGIGSATSATCFGEDVVSELPFIETHVDARGRAGDMVLTDGERLISFVRMPVVSRSPSFLILPFFPPVEEEGLSLVVKGAGVFDVPVFFLFVLTFDF
jgi:hypothetical protein